MLRKVKYIDKKHLQIYNHLSNDILKYNRTLPTEVVDALPDDKFFPIVFTLPHEHRAGKLCEPHVRCIIAVPGKDERMDQLILDVEMGLFDLLPEFNMPDRKSDEVDEPAEVSS
jgi:hypothetical protein